MPAARAAGKSFQTRHQRTPGFARLAAGRGSRLRHLGGDRPKCLVELAGKPLIVRQIGLATLRRECSDFNQWIEKIERLGATG